MHTHTSARNFHAAPPLPFAHAAALEWSGGELLGELETKLDPSKPLPQAVRQHALYCVANVLTGADAHKDAVLASNLPALLLSYLRVSERACAQGCALSAAKEVCGCAGASSQVCGAGQHVLVACRCRGPGAE